MALDFNEIGTWQQFQNLVEQYFKKVGYDTEVVDTKVDPCGIGIDGGKDIIVSFTLRDKIGTFKTKWLVQCKFHDSNIGPSELNGYNLPTLIHSQGANGYLLVVKKEVTSSITTLFECLNKNDELKLGYKYVYWNGAELESRVLTHPELIKQFFPSYYIQS